MDYLKPVIEKLFDAEALTKLEKGELTADDFVNGYVANSEKTISDRIASKIEAEKKGELQRGAYAKAEKLIAETFGLDAKKYEGVEQQKRMSTIIADLKADRESMIENLKKDYTSADAQKLQQLTQQLEQANLLLSTKDKAVEEALKQGEAKFTEYVKTQQITKLRDNLIEAVKDARVEPKFMRAVFDADVFELGYTFELDAEGIIWVNKDGQRVKHPTKPTENLKYETLFTIIAEKNQFAKLSNGGTGSGSVITDEIKSKISPKRLASLQEQGIYK